MIAAPQVLAAESGADVLRRGGNAVDAAVTAAFVQGVVDPQMGGIGGGGVMLVHCADTGADVVLEFLPRAGSRVREDQWAGAFVREAAHSFGYVLEGALNDIGYGSIGVPGTVAGLHEALARFGTIAWAEAIAPAIAVARDGFPVSVYMHQDWAFDTGPDVVAHRERLRATAEAIRVYTKGGELYAPGEILVQLDLARTLSSLAAGGSEVFYRGEVAEAMAADLQANGASLTAGDLADYRVAVTEPLRGSYRGRTVVSPGPPAGGAALIQLLNFLEGEDLGALRWPSAQEARLRARAMAWVFAEQERHMADPAFVDVPVDDLLAKDRAAEARSRSAGGSPVLAGGMLPDTPTTTNVSVVDASGNAVSLTHTLGTSSGVVTPGLGFGYNNYLNSFDPRPGSIHSLAPGKTRVTMMAPTLIMADGRPSVVIGALGGNKILTSVGQTLVNLLDHGHGVVEAVCAPRLHVDRGDVHAEGRIPSTVVDALERDGLRVNRHVHNYDLYFAMVQALRIGHDGTLHGASDPRGDGGTALHV
ncbi:MAG: gamma-glutamyltransferase [Solirubrobacteraceae bacterium MAG38_C4-C5]|nr:gamma-glutamyltransferase [Candidatus Siliceabacter maunaloa]